MTATTGLSFGNYNHGVALDPTGKYLFIARNNNNDVTRFVVDPTSGQPSDPITLAAAGGYHATVDRQGRFLFVSDWDKGGADKLSVYKIASADGVLTKVNDYSTGGGNPAGLAVTPNGSFVYVVNNTGGSIAGFSVDGASGELTAVPGSPFSLGSAVWELCLDASGHWLYAGNSLGLAGFAIDPTTGSLAPLPDSPFAVAGGVGACLALSEP